LSGYAGDDPVRDFADGTESRREIDVPGKVYGDPGRLDKFGAGGWTVVAVEAPDSISGYGGDNPVCDLAYAYV
jgi:hypothetical protein